MTIISVYIPFFIKSKRHYSIYYNRILQPCLHCTTESDLQKFNMVIVFVSFFLLWVFTILTLVSLKNNYKKLKMLNRRARKAFAAEKQMCMILILMVFAFSFSLLPTMYNYIYSTFFKNSLDLNFNYHPVSNFIYAAFLATNSIWNFIIYNVFNKNFRIALVKQYKDTFNCFYR